MLIFCNNRGKEVNKKLEIFARSYSDKNDETLIFSSFERFNDKITAYSQINYGYDSYFGEYSIMREAGDDEALLKRMEESAEVLAFLEAARGIKDIEFPWGSLSGIRPAKMVRGLLDKGMSGDEARAFMKRVYAVRDDKTELALRVAENEKKILSGMKENSVSLYIGIPFCPTRCMYCSFVSADMRISGRYMDEFFRLLLKEVEKTGELVRRAGLSAENIYIGGGTPTTLSADRIAALCQKLHECFDLSAMKEFTIEAGRPDTIDRPKLMAAHEGGVTRISINPQTMNEKTLELIGRRHTPEMIREAFETARECGFDDINADLIAGLPKEKPEDFYRSLDEVIKLSPENITVHTMCLKRAADLKNSGLRLTMAKDVGMMLSYAQKRMEEEGFEPYYMYRQKNILGNLENVGYARPDRMSFYNINIMEEAQTIIAMGGGGSSKIVRGGKIERVFNFKDPAEYIRRFDEIIKKKEEIMRKL